MFARHDLRYVAMCSVLLAVSGCQTPSAETDATPKVVAAAVVLLEALPVETYWALTSSTAKGLDRAEASSIRLNIDHKRLSGDSGCNRFSAGYQMLEKRLSVGLPAATKRGCESPAGEIEQALFAVLPTLESASMDGSDLVLHGAGDVSLRFTATAAAAED